jgi:hypothetical protein
MMAGPVAGSVEILAELKASGTARYGLTNFSAETYPVAFERFGCATLPTRCRRALKTALLCQLHMPLPRAYPGCLR